MLIFLYRYVLGQFVMQQQITATLPTLSFREISYRKSLRNIRILEIGKETIFFCTSESQEKRKAHQNIGHGLWECFIVLVLSEIWYSKMWLGIVHFCYMGERKRSTGVERIIFLTTIKKTTEITLGWLNSAAGKWKIFKKWDNSARPIANNLFSSRKEKHILGNVPILNKLIHGKSFSGKRDN